MLLITIIIIGDTLSQRNKIYSQILKLKNYNSTLKIYPLVLNNIIYMSIIYYNNLLNDWRFDMIIIIIIN